LSQGERIDRIGLHLGRRHGLELQGVGELELDSSAVEKVGDPVPAAGRLDNRAMRAVQGGKIMEKVSTTPWAGCDVSRVRRMGPALR
jgi:hypothetical protein